MTPAHHSRRRFLGASQDFAPLLRGSVVAGLGVACRQSAWEPLTCDAGGTQPGGGGARFLPGPTDRRTDPDP